MSTLNLTQHNATQEQRFDCITDLKDEDKVIVRELLTINNLNISNAEYQDRCERILDIAETYKVSEIMIGGHLPLMFTLACIAMNRGYRVYSGFSKRIVEEKGTTKTVSFVYEGLQQINYPDDSVYHV